MKRHEKSTEAHGAGARHTKKGGSVFCERKAVKYAFIKNNRHTCRVDLMAQMLSVSTSVTREQARSSIFEYIEAYFNTRRRHSAINYVTPDQFERIIWIDKVA